MTIRLPIQKNILVVTRDMLGTKYIGYMFQKSNMDCIFVKQETEEDIKYFGPALLCKTENPLLR